MHKFFRVSSWKWWFVIFALILGIFWKLDEKGQFFRLGNVEIHPEDQVLEKIFWDVLSPEFVSFWPGFLMKEHIVTKSIEERIPVNVSLEISGPGKFRLQAIPLNVTGIVLWEKNNWYISEEGYTWNAELDTGSLLSHIDENLLLKWELDESCTELLNLDKIDGPKRIIKAAFPIELLKEWREGIKLHKWIVYVDKAGVSRKGGEYIINLKLNLENSMISLILNGKDCPWNKGMDALKKIMPEFPYLEGNFKIDATYTDRIVVKEL